MKNNHIDFYFLKIILIPICLLFITFIFFGFGQETPRVLLFTKTAGFRHNSIAAGATAISKLGLENNFVVDTTSDANDINEINLSKYAAVIFLNTTGPLLSGAQRNDFERYIQAGGGFVGIHAAADAEYDWRWYGRLVGAYFDSHPPTQSAVLNVKDKNHPSTEFLPENWKRNDEWYNFKQLISDLRVLITIDESTYEGGKNGAGHPMAWYQNFEGGRSWYTSLGHVEESYTEQLYLRHILGGIKWAIGGHQKLDYTKVTSERIPEENRFVKTQLVKGVFSEPTEMTVLPNRDVLVAQRRGEIMLYKDATKTVKQVGFLDVYWKTIRAKNTSAEEGVLGLQADPDFANNHYIYVYYSPADTSVNRLSRFTFDNDTINKSSEKIILQFYSQREICCHTGGSVAFGNDNMLFLSTGDNTTPFDEPGKPPYKTNGFAPLDDRPGYENFDARRSAGNTNDLRGKILRIKIKSDGTYSIPEGNLFKPGEALTKPEIYVMGDRNPYRISVDKKNNFLYWGEVGPDANVDSLSTRGPRGYDEFNQARSAGFFGWPLFIGPNIPYRPYDYATGISGESFDPLKPVNDSRNNNGLKILPPAKPPLMWYPYALSADFPSLGSGGRTAMAGPAYHSEMFPEKTRFPVYFNNKIFIYDWIRAWIKVVTLQPNGDFDKIESFMPSAKFNAPVDMETGPDGSIYVLEYGSGWFVKNADAGLVRIDYNAGNRAPEIIKLHSSKTAGKLPLKVLLTVEAKDPEKQKMSYIWNPGNGITYKTKVPSFAFTYTKKGKFNVTVNVKDEQNASKKSRPLTIAAGYLPNKLSKENLNHEGKALMLTLDCKACHKIDEKSVGPAFTKVAKKYSNNKSSIEHLTKKIIQGGSGVWGDVAMPAHPSLKQEEATKIADWILSIKQ